jgi:hypothetical protein
MGYVDLYCWCFEHCIALRMPKLTIYRLSQLPEDVAKVVLLKVKNGYNAVSVACDATKCEVFMVTVSKQMQDVPYKRLICEVVRVHDGHVYPSSILRDFEMTGVTQQRCTTISLSAVAYDRV